MRPQEETIHYLRAHLSTFAWISLFLLIKLSWHNGSEVLGFQTRLEIKKKFKKKTRIHSINSRIVKRREKVVGIGRRSGQFENFPGSEEGKTVPVIRRGQMMKYPLLRHYDWSAPAIAFPSNYCRLFFFNPVPMPFINSSWYEGFIENFFCPKFAKF